jgi:hypothetical protein
VCNCTERDGEAKQGAEVQALEETMVKLAKCGDRHHDPLCALALAPEP